MLSETTGMLGKKIYQKTLYDHYGRTVESSLPFFDVDQGIGEHPTTFEYDDLDRLVTTSLPYGAASISQSYSVDSITGRPQVVSIDAENKSTTAYSNALGQVVEIVDADSNSLKYTFDAQGNLKQTEDALGNLIIVAYDDIGRRKSLDDPDMGTT